LLMTSSGSARSKSTRSLPGARVVPVLERLRGTHACLRPSWWTTVPSSSGVLSMRGRTRRQLAFHSTRQTYRKRISFNGKFRDECLNEHWSTWQTPKQ
jgi:hypothetical protein